MRPIDADALKEFIDDCGICAICPHKAPRCSYDCDFPDFVTEKWNVAIDAQPTIDAVRVEWIPCEERLPNRQGHYICTCKDGSKYKRTTTVKWSNGWQLTGSRAYWIVLAWMPLPEPWKGADDE